MIVTCPKCDLIYDDLHGWTICPHMPIECGWVPYHPLNNEFGYCRRDDLIGPHLCAEFGSVVPYTGAGFANPVPLVALASDGKRSRRSPWWKDCDALGHGDPICPTLVDQESRSITLLQARCRYCYEVFDARRGPAEPTPALPCGYHYPCADVVTGAYTHVELVPPPHPFMSRFAYLVTSGWPFGPSLERKRPIDDRYDRHECPDCLKANGGRPGGIIVCDTERHPRAVTYNDIERNPNKTWR